MMQPAELDYQIQSLLAKAKLSTIITSFENWKNGGNSRIFKLKTTDDVYIVKQYFRQQHDPRDRLASEYVFLSYANLAAPGMVPKQYAQDPENGLALYEFIDGQSLQVNDISANEISSAIEFFRQLNQEKLKSKAMRLPLASEACFSLQQHFDLISNRIIQLQQITPETAEDLIAEQYIKRINHCWQDFLRQVEESKKWNAIALNAALDDSQRCISPSDFGFHNALKMNDGTIRFLDFEYAGWDDPAKMTGDFFSQLAVPVNAEFFDRFAQETLSFFPRADELMHRARLTRFVYQVKWCCIVLNIFIPFHMARRRFANPDLSIDALKKAQLVKAEKLVKKLENYNYATY